MPSREDWMRRLGPLYGGAVALVSSTSWRWPDEVADEPRSPAWVVVVGVPIGVLAWLLTALLHGLGIPAPIAALVGLATLSLASAAIVERGVVERIDRTADTSPSITAILLLVFATLVRAAAIVSVPPAHWLGVFVATPLVGRWAAVFLQGIGDPVYDVAPRSLVANRAPAWLTAGLSAVVAVVAVFALGQSGLVVLAITAVLVFAVGVDAQRRDLGLSAPVVAIAAEIGEVAVLFAATIAR